MFIHSCVSKSKDIDKSQQQKKRIETEAISGPISLYNKALNSLYIMVKIKGLVRNPTRYLHLTLPGDVI